MNLKHVFLLSLMPSADSAQWKAAAGFVKTLDSFSLADSVFLVRDQDWKGLAEEVESRLSKKGTYCLLSIAPIPSSLNAKSVAPERLMAWLHKR